MVRRLYTVKVLLFIDIIFYLLNEGLGLLALFLFFVRMHLMREIMKKVSDGFINILDRELTSKYLLVLLINKGEGSDGVYKEILSSLMSLYIESNIHTLFLPKTIMSLSETIHTNLLLREFIVEVIDKLNLLLGQEDMQIFCSEVQKNLEILHSGDEEYYAGPRQYVLSLYFDPSAMETETLMKNHWLMFMLLLILFFDKSIHFNGLNIDTK